MTSSPKVRWWRTAGSCAAPTWGEWLGIPPTGNHFTASGISVYRIAEGKVMEGWISIIEMSPAEEEQRWLTEGGGGWPRRSADLLPSTERDTSRTLWEV